MPRAIKQTRHGNMLICVSVWRSETQWQRPSSGTSSKRAITLGERPICGNQVSAIWDFAEEVVLVLEHVRLLVVLVEQPQNHIER